MLTLSLFNFKDNEGIYISVKHAKKQINENFFKFSFMIKKSIAKDNDIFYFILPAIH